MSPRTRRILLIGLLVIVGEVIFGLAIYQLATAPDPEPTLTDEAPVVAVPKIGAVYDKLPTIIANPAGAGGNRFLVLELDLLLESEEVIATIDARHSRVNDALLGLLTHKRMDQVDEASEEEILKRQIVTLLNQQLPGGGVVDVIIKKLIVQ